jgi:HD-GYP domain-containing protein (c-di-GMP phosphodiesterase class II)
MNTPQTRINLFSEKLQTTRSVSRDDHQHDYYPLNILSLIPGNRLGFGLYIKTVESNNNKIHYLPFAYKDEVLEDVWLVRLHQMDIQRLYFKKEDLELVIDWLNNNLALPENQGAPTPERKLRLIYDLISLKLQKSYHNLQLASCVRDAVEQMDRTIEELERSQFPLQLLWEILSRDYTLYSHAINVFIISSALMAYLRKNASDCRILGIAALFHDVGMTKVSEDILFKAGPLSDGEWLAVKEHPQYSFGILKKFTFIPKDSIQLILEHHENADGSGYPTGLNIFSQHPHSQIIRLVDAFAAMTAHRPYRPPYSAFQALKILKEQRGAKGPVFDQKLLTSFIAMFSG